MKYQRNNKDFILYHKSDALYIKYIGEKPIYFTMISTGIEIFTDKYTKIFYTELDNNILKIANGEIIVKNDKESIKTQDCIATLYIVNLSIERPEEILTNRGKML